MLRVINPHVFFTPSPGHEVRECQSNGTFDDCVPCDRGLNQSHHTSSFTEDRCDPWPLNQDCRKAPPKSIFQPRPTGADAKIGNHKDPDDQTKRCMCNIEYGKMYERPMVVMPGMPIDSFCQRMPRPCELGMEPTVDGSESPF